MAHWRGRWRAGIGSILLLGSGLGMGSCERGPGPEIRIGVLSYVTGERRQSSGKFTGEALELAERAVNRAGGLLVGRRRFRVRMLIRDIGDQADRATSEARRLINEDGVIALIGPQFSRDAIPVASLAEQARVLMITPMSSHPRTTLGKRFVFRVAYTDDVQGGSMARFARETLGVDRAALLYDVAGEYSRTLAGIFRAEFEAEGGTIVAEEQFTSDEATDFTAQLTRIRATHPDVIFAPNFLAADSIQLVQARRLGITATFLGTDSWDPELLAPVAEAEGAYMSSQWHKNISSVEADSFIAAYHAAYGRDPLATAAATFDAAQLLFCAIERAGSLDPDAIRDAMAATTGYRGVTGVLDYQGHADPAKSVFVLKITGGHGVFERRIDPR